MSGVDRGSLMSHGSHGILKALFEGHGGLKMTRIFCRFKSFSILHKEILSCEDRRILFENTQFLGKTPYFYPRISMQATKIRTTC